MRDSNRIDSKIAKDYLHELMRINIVVDDELYQKIIDWGNIRELLNSASKILNKLIIFANGG
jgi:hypothetical protein